MSKNIQNRNGENGERTPLARIVRQAINADPILSSFIARGLINNSSLARAICEAYGLKNQQAVIAACRRFRLAHRSSGSDAGERIRALLHSARISVFAGRSVCVLRKPYDYLRLARLQERVLMQGASLQVIEGEAVSTLLLPDAAALNVRREFTQELVSTTSGLAQINLQFKRQIESTPGVVAYVCAVMAAEGVNLKEQMSCWTEFVALVHQRDQSKALKVLSEAGAHGLLGGQG